MILNEKPESTRPQNSIIYNVTVKLQTEITDDWIQWLKTEHIPEIIATGCFYKAQILKLIETDDPEGITYAIQYHAESYEKYRKYIDQFAAGMRQKGYEKWGNRFIAFRTVMQVIN